MLRLRPSELTLTPDDVEETFRRIAYRRAHGMPTSHHAQPSTQPGRPILRHGPQRSVRNAITTIGHDPVLNPRSQHAIHTPEEDDDIDAAYESISPRRDQRVDSVSSSTTTSHARFRYTLPISSAAPSVPRNIQLPLRLARSHEELLAQSVSDIQTLEEASESSHHLSGHATFDRARKNTSDQANKVPSQSGSTTTANSPAELRGGGDHSNTQRAQAGRDAHHVPSTLHQVHTFSSPQNEMPHPDSANPHDDETRTQYLQGYFTGQGWLGYDFHTLDPAPHTEPRRQTQRHQVPTRSRSSGSAPSIPLSTQQRNTSTNSADDVFGGIAAPEPPSRLRSRLSNIQDTFDPYPQPENTSAPRSTRFNSGASNGSLAYSYYELPASRQSSSGQDQHLPSQFDGTFAATSSNPGAYYSIPASQVHAADNSSQYPSPYPLSNQAAAGQHGVSPLPAIPYTRTRGTTGSSTGSFGMTDMDGQYLDATTAAIRGLSSPLDQFQEHFRELARAQNTRRAVSGQIGHSQTQVGNLQIQVGGFGLHQSHQDQNHYTEGDAQPHGWSSHGQSPAPIFHTNTHYSGIAPPGFTNPAQSTQWNSPETRQVPREVQASTHESAYARLQNAIQAIQQTSARSHQQPSPSRHSMPQSTTPHDVSNQTQFQSQAQAQSTWPPMVNGIPRHSHYERTGPPANPAYTQEFPHLSQAFSSTHISPPIIPPRRQHTSSASTRPHAHAHAHAHHYLAPPSTLLTLDHGSGTTSRRSPVVRAATLTRAHRPRVSTQQMNQENSGEAEEAMMRREREAVLARYGVEGGGEVMDETPPRVGRVERRMG